MKFFVVQLPYIQLFIKYNIPEYADLPHILGCYRILNSTNIKNMMQYTLRINVIWNGPISMIHATNGV